jgi:hypothetical protein
MTLTLANHDFWKTLDNSREFQVQNRMALIDGSTFDLVDTKTDTVAFSGSVYESGRAELGNMYASGQTNIVQYEFVDRRYFSVGLILKPRPETLHIPTAPGPVAGLGVPPDPQVFINDGEEPPESYDNDLSTHNELTKNMPKDPYTYEQPVYNVVNP